jgi:hypothetical protein
VAGVAAEATEVAAFMPHSVEVAGLAAGGVAVAAFTARLEDFMHHTSALGVDLMALLRIMAARYI